MKHGLNCSCAWSKLSRIFWMDFVVWLLWLFPMFKSSVKVVHKFCWMNGECRDLKPQVQGVGVAELGRSDNMWWPPEKLNFKNPKPHLYAIFNNFNKIFNLQIYLNRKKVILSFLDFLVYSQCPYTFLLRCDWLEISRRNRLYDVRGRRLYGGRKRTIQIDGSHD